MSTTYDFLKAFPVNIDALGHEITAEALPEAEKIQWNEDETPNNLHITFENPLDSGQQTALAGVVLAHTGDPWDYPANELGYYEKGPNVWTDAKTGISAKAELMQGFIARRELFNDSDNPIYLPDHTPILGAGGWGEDHASRIGNLENIHAKLGWHNQQVLEGLYTRPKDMMIYYGWPSGFNAYWNNELVAQDLARYGLVVLGAGLENPSHGDYSNTVAIVARVKQLNPSCFVFGYVSTQEMLTNFETKTDQWKTVGAHGIFLDVYGYDYGNTRAQQNERVDYVHGEGMVAFANCWNMNHALGTANDPSYPNSTYNSGEVESSLNVNDWYLMESYLVNTTAYTSPADYEPKAQWAARVVTMLGLRATYGINVAGAGIVDDATSGGQGMFDFAFTGALMASLGAYGVSDTSYGASSGKGKWWTRPDVTGMGKVWTLNPSIQVDADDADVYHRQSELARMTIDFSTGAETCSITKW